MRLYMKNKIFCCYSLELRNYLSSKNIKYDAVGLNPNSQKMFWAYVKDKKLDNELKVWKGVKE